MTTSTLPSLHLPGTPAYDAAVLPWNRAVTPRPAVVVEATCAVDVAAAVRLAHERGLRVAVQATGHGIASDLDGVVLVSTRAMTGLTIDRDARTARVEAGVRWSEVLEAASPYGLTALAGSAPHVGVVGYTTGGGLGPLAHTHGLTSDRVRAFEVVTGDGEVRRATPTEHADLFRGLRGGKGLLGIVTAVELELLPLTEVYGGAVYFDGTDAAAVLHRWATWSAGLPREATTSVALLRLPPLPHVPPPLAGRLSVAVRFAWTGAPAAGAEVLAGMRDVATPLVDTVAVLPCTAIGTIHSDPVDPMPVHETHALLGDLPADAVDRLLSLAGPEAECPQVVVELRRLGGALAEAPAHPDAYDHREAGLSLFAVGIAAPPVVGAVTAHGDALLSGMAPWSTGGGLPNLAPRPGVEWLRSRYAAPTLARLAEVSSAYDPEATVLGARDLRLAVER